MIDTTNPPLCTVCYEPLTTEGKCLYQAEHDTFERAEEEALVTFWRDEWPEEGQAGDDAGHSPIGHAIYVLRRLRKTAMSDVARGEEEMNRMADAYGQGQESALADALRTLGLAPGGDAFAKMADMRARLDTAELRASERWDQFRDRERDTALLRIENEVQAENDRCVDAMLKALNGILRRKKE